MPSVITGGKEFKERRKFWNNLKSKFSQSRIWKKDKFINVLDFVFKAGTTNPSRSVCLHLGQLLFTAQVCSMELSMVPDISRELSDFLILWAWRCWLSSAETILNCFSSLHPDYLQARNNTSVFSPVQSLASFLGAPASTHTCWRVNSSYNLSVGMCIPSLNILSDGDF